jgi:hypothetical protein
MSTPIKWSIEKQQRLAQQLSGYWAADIWKIGDCQMVKLEGLGKAYRMRQLDSRAFLLP